MTLEPGSGSSGVALGGVVVVIDGRDRKRQANVRGGRRVVRQVKLSVAQDEVLQVHARELGVSVQRLLVESTLSSFAGQTVTERRDVLTALFMVQRALAAVGNNLNQLVRVANEAGVLPESVEASLGSVGATVKRIDGCLDALSLGGEIR